MPNKSSRRFHSRRCPTFLLLHYYCFCYCAATLIRQNCFVRAWAAASPEMQQRTRRKGWATTTTSASQPRHDYHRTLVVRGGSDVRASTAGSGDLESGNFQTIIIQPSSMNTTVSRSDDDDDHARRTTLIYALSLLSGTSHIYCYKRFSCFAAMMTGNTIRLCVHVVEGNVPEIMFETSLVCAYVAGSALYQCLVATTRTPIAAAKMYKPLPFGLGATICLTMVAADVLHLLIWPHRPRVIVPLTAVGFGAVNAASLDALGTVTNAVTGHWQKLGMGALDYGINNLINQSMTARSKLPEAAVQSGKIVASFVAPLLAGAWLFRWLETRRTVWLLPFGTTFGILYWALFAWYSREWPFVTQPRRQQQRAYLTHEL